MDESKLVHLTVETLSGSFDGDFAVDQKLQDVIDKAFRSLDVKPNPGEKWVLQYQGADLDPQSTIADNKIPDGATLTLAQEEGGGGFHECKSAG